MSSSKNKNLSIIKSEIQIILTYLKVIVRSLESNFVREKLELIIKELKDISVDIFFISEFMRGKTTCINALLGKELLPVNVLPTTFKVCRVIQNSTPKAIVYLNKGGLLEIEIKDLEKYISFENTECEISRATILYPFDFYDLKVSFTDTPGLNNLENFASSNIIQELKQDNIVIVIIGLDSPLSQSEQTLIQEISANSESINQLFILINRIDTVDSEDREEAFEVTKQRVNKAYQLNNADSGRLYFFPISAKNALKGKLNKDTDLVEKSGFLEFESKLRSTVIERKDRIFVSIGFEKLNEIFNLLETEIKENKTPDEDVIKKLNALATKYKNLTNLKYE